MIITPHAVYYSEEAIRTVRDFAAHEVVRVLTGLPLGQQLGGLGLALQPGQAQALIRPRHLLASRQPSVSGRPGPRSGPFAYGGFAEDQAGQVMALPGGIGRPVCGCG